VRVKPALAAQVRLRWDTESGQTLLLAPGRGLLLDETATAIAAMCDGTHSVEDIARVLYAEYAGAELEDIARDVDAFVDELLIRGFAELEA
jgi:coenzyme PQQ biosynthesis protein PqqD